MALLQTMVNRTDKTVTYHHAVMSTFPGALTKGDRRAAIGADLMEFNLDTPYGRSALKIMYNSISQVR